MQCLEKYAIADDFSTAGSKIIHDLYIMATTEYRNHIKLKK